MKRQALGSNARRFIIDVGREGFKAYVFADAILDDAGELQLVAASSSVSTFIKVMETIINSQTPEVERHIHFAIAPPAPAACGHNPYVSGIKYTCSKCGAWPVGRDSEPQKEPKA